MSSNGQGIADHSLPSVCSKLRLTWLSVALAAQFISAAGCSNREAQAPVASDEAMKRAQYEQKSVRDAATEYFYPRDIVDYFHGMDSIAEVTSPHQLLDDPSTVGSDRSTNATTRVGLPELTRCEMLGRNTWMIWCAGNEGFWDWLATDNLGFIDFLKLVDSRQRSQRFATAGMVNEPNMTQSRSPAAEAFGLWLDEPEEAWVREWRRKYLESTFREIRSGTHKSQRGLKVYRGDRSSISDDESYDSPDSYMDEQEYGENHHDDHDYDQIPPPDIYGISSGVIGLRLFPNPYFVESAQKKWDADKFYRDEEYWSDPQLVRPFRVGMSCAFCHASFHPLKPARDITNPEWENISGNIGAQYLKMRATVGSLLTKDQFAYHLLESQPAGTIDTSLIASDNINNPNTMNAIFRLPERTLLSYRNPRERLSSAGAKLPSVWEHPDEITDDGKNGSVPQKWADVFAIQGLSGELQESNDNPRHVPRILLDGSDSIGAWGALARVYLNIGSYYERWNQLHEPVIGFKPQRPFTISDCRQHSVYWNATEQRVGPLRDYFLKITPPMPLLGFEIERPSSSETNGQPDEAAAQSSSRANGARLFSAPLVDKAKLKRGREVFARNCIVCHSSIQPESSLATLFPAMEAERATQLKAEDSTPSKFYRKYKALILRRLEKRNEWASAGEFWEHDPGQWLRDEDYLEWAADVVSRPAFWEQNYLSTDYRIPINLVQTNSGRAMATNALTGNMWEDFSSRSYREMPGPGLIPYFNPYAGEQGELEHFSPRHQAPAGAPHEGGGPGFYRVPSLISIWATAPFLHNNSLGVFNNDPSVEGRLEAFDDAIRKLLWPERRLESSSYNEATAERLHRDNGLIWRTTEDSYLVVKSKIVPHFARRLPWIADLQTRFPWLRDVWPLWLPSVVSFVAGFLALRFSNSASRKSLSYAVLFVAVLLWTIASLLKWYPQASLLDSLRNIKPYWLLAAITLATGLALWLPISSKWRRYSGYSLIILAVALGAVVYFNAGQLGDLRLGPIPKGTPVNLIANVNPDATESELKKAFQITLDGLAEIKSRNLNLEDTREVLRKKIAPALMNVSKCPDFVMDRGHNFEWFNSMTDDDKESLIELLKTF